MNRNCPGRFDAAFESTRKAIASRAKMLCADSGVRERRRVELRWALLALALIATGCLDCPMFRFDSRHSATSQSSTASTRGILKWKYAFPAGCRIQSSPAVDGGGRIYVGVICGNDPDLRKLTGGFCSFNPSGSLAW